MSENGVQDRCFKGQGSMYIYTQWPTSNYLIHLALAILKSSFFSASILSGPRRKAVRARELVVPSHMAVGPGSRLAASVNGIG